MKLLNHYINNTITVFFQNSSTSNYEYLLMIYYAFLFAATYCVGSVFLVITSIRNFFLAFELFWLLVIATTAIVSSKHWYGIMKNATRLCIAVIIGAILSYISLAMVGRSVWPNVFIFFTLLLLLTGPMMTSTLCPFYLFRFIFLTYYYLTFEDTFRHPFFSPKDQLLFCLGSFASFGACLVSCLLFRVPFANNLYIQHSNNILKRSKSYIKKLKKQTNYIFNSNNQENEIDKIYIKDIDEIENKNKLKCKKKLEFHFHQYSQKLNELDQTLSDSRKEFWAKDYIVHYERIQIIFERNLKKLITIGFSLTDDISNDTIKSSLPIIIPHLNLLFDEILFIFTQMSNQLKYEFIHTQDSSYCQWFKNSKAHEYYNKLDLENESTTTFHFDNLDFIYNIDNFGGDYKKGSLEWNQLEINKSFKRIDNTIKNIDDLFVSVFSKFPDKFDPNDCNSVSKVYILLKLFIAFCIEQKLLSKEIFLVSYHNSLNRNKPQEYLALIATFKKFYNFLSTIKKRNIEKKEKQQQENQDFPPIIRVSYSNKEKFKIYFKHLLYDRWLYNWLFTLKYSLVCSIGAVTIYEIKKHSKFQLFEMLNWILNTYIVAAGPDVGSMGVLTIIRVLTIITGGFIGYATIIIAELGENDASKALIYIGLSFFFIFLFGVILNYQRFENMVTNIVFTFSVVTVPSYDSGSNIIFTLYRTGYVAIGFILILIFSSIIPYLDYRELEKNLYKIPHCIIQLADYLIYYKFNSKDDDTNAKLLYIPYSRKTKKYVFNNMDYNNHGNVNQINTKKNFEIFEAFFMEQYKTIFCEKLINLRRIFQYQRNLLAGANFELIFSRDKYESIEDLVLNIQHLHDLFGALEVMFIEIEGTNIKPIGFAIKSYYRTLFNNLEYTSLLLSEFPVETNNLGKIIKPSSYLQLETINDNSIDYTNYLIDNVNEIYKNYNLSILEHHHLNATLFTLYRFVYHYKLVYNKLIDYKQIMVAHNKIYTLNNNNFKLNSIADVK